MPTVANVHRKAGNVYTLTINREGKVLHLTVACTTTTTTTIIIIIII